METQYREQYICFGLKVQYYRKLRGLTQEAFADKIGKSWSFVAKVESPTRAFWCVDGNAVQDRGGAGSPCFKAV